MAEAHAQETVASPVDRVEAENHLRRDLSDLIAADGHATVVIGGNPLEAAPDDTYSRRKGALQFESVDDALASLRESEAEDPSRTFYLVRNPVPRGLNVGKTTNGDRRRKPANSRYGNPPEDGEVARLREWLLDVDPIGEPFTPQERDAVVEAIRSLELPLYHILDSGRGVQADVHLAQPADYSPLNHAFYSKVGQELNVRLREALASLGLTGRAQVDDVANPARQSRLPGMTNPRTGRRALFVERERCTAPSMEALCQHLEIEASSVQPKCPVQAGDEAEPTPFTDLSQLDPWLPDGHPRRERVHALVLYCDELCELRDWADLFPAKSDNSASAWQFDALCELARAGVPADLMAGTLLADPSEFRLAHVSQTQRTESDRASGQRLQRSGRRERLAEYVQRQVARAIAETSGCDPGGQGDSEATTVEEGSDSGGSRARDLALVDLADFNLEELPLRAWLMPGLLLDGQVTLVAARGGSAKSLFGLQVSIAVAMGSGFAHWESPRSATPLIMNAEDDLDEMRRRIVSACDVMEVEREDLVGRLSLLAARSLVLVERSEDGDGRPKRTPLYHQLVTAIREQGIGLLVVDPLIETHAGLDENSNSDMKEVILALRDIARICKIPVLVVHHTRKSAGPGDQDGARGGSALINAVRLAITLTPLGDGDRERLPEEEREEWWRFIRVHGAKANYSARGGELWLKLVSVDIGNGGEEDGDSCPGLVGWAPPGTDLVEGGVPLETWSRLGEFLEQIRQGRDDGRGWTAGRGGRSEGQAYGLLKQRFGLGAAQAAGLLDRLVDEGYLAVEQRRDPHNRRPMNVFAVGPRATAVPGPSAEQELPF